MQKKVTTLVSLLIFIISCSSLPSDVDVFYMGDKGMQYFFPSKSWRTENKDYKLEADWLYRNYPLEGENKARTILNFTLRSNKTTVVAVPQQIIISTDKYELVIPKEQIKIIYIDMGKTRYTSWFTSEQMKELMASATKTVRISMALNPELIFDSPEEFTKHLKYFQEVILPSKN